MAQNNNSRLLENGIRPCGYEVEYTDKQISEIIRCKEDIIYFAENYFHIVNVDEGRHKIRLREYQRRILKAFASPPPNKISGKPKRHCILLSSRQIGKTTITILFALHYILFNKDKTAAVLANNEKIAKEILKKIKMAYSELPIWMQHGIKAFNELSIELETGSRIIASATGGGSVRGLPLNLVILDEFAFVPNNIAEEFMGSVYPTMSSGKTTQMIILSTPNGLNHFYNIWNDAVKDKNSYVPIKVNWYEIPGRDEQWKTDTIADIGRTKFNQEFGAQFLGSSNTLIDNDLFEKMDPAHAIETKYDGRFRIYEYPEHKYQYILGIDIAHGVGGDSSVIQVLKVEDERNVKQVAVYQSSEISPHDFCKVIIAISDYYEDAQCIIESNDVGSAVLNLLWYEHEFDRIVNFDRHGFGVRANKKTKLAACMNMKKYIEKFFIELVDPKTILELSLFEEVQPNIFKAAAGKHDDLVTSLMWGLYFLSTDMFDGKGLLGSEINEYSLVAEDQQTPIFVDDNPNVDFWEEFEPQTPRERMERKFIKKENEDIEELPFV